MPTLDSISKELMAAMKAQDAVRTSTLRMLVAALRNREIEKKKTLAEGDVLEVIGAEAKRRRESVEEYRKANREDLAAREAAEQVILQAYLPKALTASELQALVAGAIQSAGAKSPQDMGKVMSVLMPQIKGRADGKQAQQLVAQALSK